MAEQRNRPGNTPVEQQERNPDDVKATRRTRLAVSGPGAADFVTAGRGMDRPEPASPERTGRPEEQAEGDRASRGGAAKTGVLTPAGAPRPPDRLEREARIPRPTVTSED